MDIFNFDNENDGFGRGDSELLQFWVFMSNFQGCVHFIYMLYVYYIVYIYIYTLMLYVYLFATPEFECWHEVGKISFI